MRDKLDDHDELIEQIACRFANESQAIREMLQMMRSNMEKFEDGGWIGLGADAFFSEMQSVIIPAIQRLESALNNAAKATREVTQTMRQAEQDAGSIFGDFRVM